MDEQGSIRNAPRRSKRRGFLAGGVALFSAAWLPRIGTGKRRAKRERGGRCERGRKEYTGHRDPYERSLYLRERAGWSNREWRAYLSKRGIRHGARERRYAIPRGEAGSGADGTSSDDSDLGDGQVTIRKLDPYELAVQVTYSRPWYVGYDAVDVEWTFTDQEFDDFPQSPADDVAISFRPDHYAPTDARKEWVYYGDACEDPSGIDSKTAGGAVCAWRDYQDWDENSYFGVYVEPNWTEYSEWERRIYVDFVHTWSGYGLAGVSVGPGGISMSFTEDTDRWDVEDSAAEARLIDGERVTG